MATTTRILRRQAIGLESTRGTGVAATHRLFGMTKLNLDQPVAPIPEEWGSLSAVRRTIQGLKSGNATFAGTLNFEDMPFWGGMALKYLSAPSTASSGSAPNKTANIWNFTGDETVDTLRTATFEWTDATQSWQAPFCICNSLQFGMSLGGPVTVNAGFLMPNRATTTETVLALAATRTPLLGAKSTVYLDDATIGTTQLTGTVTDWSVGVNNNITPLYFCDGSQVWSDVERGPREISASVTMRMGSTALTEITKWAAATTRQLEIRLVGPILDAANYSAVSETVKFQLAGPWTAAVIGESGNTVTVQFALVPAYDSTLASNIKLIYSGTVGNLTGL